MTEQEKREKVIKGLECCNPNEYQCFVCPYDDGYETCARCKPALHSDAIALLKAQEPNVMAGAGLTDAELMERVHKAPVVLKPAADAISVEWIKNRLVAMLRGTASAESCFAVMLLLADWQREQEGGAVNDG